jgi:hypothetical protein
VLRIVLKLGVEVKQLFVIYEIPALAILSLLHSPILQFPVVTQYVNNREKMANPAP